MHTHLSVRYLEKYRWVGFVRFQSIEEVQLGPRGCPLFGVRSVRFSELLLY